MWSRSRGRISAAARRAFSPGAAFGAVIFLAAIAPSALAEPEYQSARTFAEANGFAYRAIVQGRSRGCSLSNSEHRIVAMEGMNNVVLDGQAMTLTAPIKMDGETAMFPSDAVKLLNRRLGVEGSPPPADAHEDEPEKTPPDPVKTVRAFRVMIDPGHGGDDVGAQYGGLDEKVVNLDIGLRVGKELQRRGILVTMTRKDDRFPTLMERVAMANRTKPDLFVSVHANAEESGSATGAMTMYPADERIGNKPNLHDRAKQAMNQPSAGADRYGAAGSVNRSVMLAVTYAAFESYRANGIRAAGMVQNALEPVVGTRPKNKGVIEDWRGLAVLSWVHAPAVLVEVDFLSNDDARRKLKQPDHRQKIAEAIADGIERYLKATGTGEAK